MKMMEKILLWKSVEQRVEMKLNYLQGIFSICTKSMLTNKDGKRKSLNLIPQGLEDTKKLFYPLVEKKSMESLNTKVERIVYNECRKQNHKVACIRLPPPY